MRMEWIQTLNSKLMVTSWFCLGVIMEDGNGAVDGNGAMLKQGWGGPYLCLGQEGVGELQEMGVAESPVNYSTGKGFTEEKENGAWKNCRCCFAPTLMLLAQLSTWIFKEKLRSIFNSKEAADQLFQRIQDFLDFWIFSYIWYTKIIYILSLFQISR